MIIIVSDKNKSLVNKIIQRMKAEYRNSEVVSCEDRMMAIKKTIFMNADLLICGRGSHRMTPLQLEMILRNNIPKTRVWYIEDMMGMIQEGAMAV